MGVDDFHSFLMHSLIGWSFLIWRCGDFYVRKPYIGMLKEVVQKKWYIIQTYPLMRTKVQNS